MTARNPTSVVLAALMMAGVAGCAPDVAEYEEPGPDFTLHHRALYDRWDADANGVLDDDEFYDGIAEIGV